jgi:mRNA-degrading endonuclease toxin of MazEF toxin-antitoxin module
MRRGEVWWAEFDERRPVVLLSEEEPSGFRAMQVVAPADTADRVRPVARRAVEVYGPPLAETLARYQHGRVVLGQAAVRPAAKTTLAERIARVLAFRGTPVLVENIARELGAPGNLRDRTRLVRAELRGCGAFVEVSRGRWMLGEPGAGPAAPLPLTEVVDYLDRVHKNARRPAA